MKLLFYNWIQFDDPEGRSGGVRHYESNLIDHLVATTGHEITTVASGVEYDKFKPQTRFERTVNRHGDRVASFAVVNSPVMAPGHRAFESTNLFDDGAALRLWHDFLGEHGPFDVIHFDSLEGIPFSWLRIHELHPSTRVLLYAHNYHSVCPQVNLWKREKETCVDYHDGKDCATCIPDLINPNEVLRGYQLSRLLRRAGMTPGQHLVPARLRPVPPDEVDRDQWGPLPGGDQDGAGHGRSGPASRRAGATGSGVRAGTSRPRPTPFRWSPAAPQHLHAGMVTPTRSRCRSPSPPRSAGGGRMGTDLINREVDVVAAASERTAEVLAARGIDRRLIEVCYIGTRVAEEEDVTLRRTSLGEPDKLTVAYLGYMRLDKGFAMMLSALKAAPRDLQQQLRLVVAAKRSDERLFDTLREVAQQLDDVRFYDGYTHDDLPTILENVDVGLVPVQWEDNLPQVAIEMMAQGVPLLTSDRGGAQELGGRNPEFVFEATKPSSLIERLGALASGETPLKSFWDGCIPLSTMTMHTDRLMQLYRPPADAAEPAPRSPPSDRRS